MNLKIIKSVRTNNVKDESVMQKITDVWKEASSVLENHDGVTYGLYHDYESDFKGDYTLSVAIQSEDKASSIHIPNTNKYKVFEVDTSVESGILNSWKQIWESEENGNVKRAYTYDYENYYPDGRIEIYIATR
nr:effector binding domain-containing protein [Paenibacillus bovis]